MGVAYTKLVDLKKAVVVDTDDPAGLNRVKIRILSIDGPFLTQTIDSLTNRTAITNRVTTDNLMWAEICYANNRLVQPDVNQVVLVGFINGNIKSPVILGWLGYEYTNNEEPLTSVYNGSA